MYTIKRYRREFSIEAHFLGDIYMVYYLRPTAIIFVDDAKEYDGPLGGMVPCR